MTKLREIQFAIEKNCEIYFGIRSGLLTDLIKEAVITDIVKKFDNLSIKDLDFSFEKYAVKSESWKAITKAEILAPVFTWWNKKESIRLEFEKFENEGLEDARRESDALEFKEKALGVYRESVSSLEWLGSIFEASAIARDVAEHIEQDVKSNLWKETVKAKEEADEIEKERKKYKQRLIPENFGHSIIRLYSLAIVELGIENGVEL